VLKSFLWNLATGRAAQVCYQVSNQSLPQYSPAKVLGPTFFQSGHWKK